MAQPDDLEARVSALETQVHELTARVQHSEQDAAAARVLAGGADHDVARIRGEIRDFRQATTSSFNAMRDDLGDLRQRTDRIDTRLAGIDTRLAGIDARFDAVDNGFIQVRGLLDAAAAGQQEIVRMIGTVIDQQGRQ